MKRSHPDVVSMQGEPSEEAWDWIAQKGAPFVIHRLEPFVQPQRKQRLLEVMERRLATVSVLFDAPYDPHNGAAVARSCEAFGVQTLQVIQPGAKEFLLSRAVARGTQKWIDVICHPTASDAVKDAQARGMELVAAHPEGTLLPEALASIPRLCLVMGNERSGIGEELAQACTKWVKVPMRGFVESLNVSVTTAILLHAATQHRVGDLEEETKLRLYARGLMQSVPHAQEILSAAGSAL